MGINIVNGKTCMLLRGTTNEFVDQHHPTIGVDFQSVSLRVDGRALKLQIWDTAGQERFHSITSAYYVGSYGIVMVYDITDRKSFLRVSDYWFPEAKRHSSPNTKLLLVGNKADLVDQRQVSTEEGSALAAQLGIPWMETSAKTSHNISAMFDTLCREILADKQITAQIQVRQSQAFVPVASRALPEVVEPHRQSFSTCCS